MKKIFFLFLSCALALSICPAAMALDNTVVMNSERVSATMNNAEAFLNAVGSEHTLEKPVPMYNFNEDIEVLYFPLLPTGYLVASYKDGHVIEFSAEGNPITTENVSNKLYYNGIMEYYEQTDNGNLLHAVTDNIVARDRFQEVFDMPALTNIPVLDYQAPVAAYGVDSENPVPINYVSYVEKRFTCPIVGVTNLLQYYHDFKNADVYPDNQNVTSVLSLRDFLKVNNYVPSTVGEYLSWIAIPHFKGGVKYLGLNTYFNRDDVDSYKINAPSASVHEVKTQLKVYERPVLLDINNKVLTGEETTSRHIVMAYNYWETANTTYFILNDGYGKNGVFICADDMEQSFEILYFS